MLHRPAEHATAGKPERRAAAPRTRVLSRVVHETRRSTALTRAPTEPLTPPWFSIGALALAIFAVATGAIDIVIGKLVGAPLALATTVRDTTGAPGLFVYILAHNLGIGFIVFGFGSAAYAFERNVVDRRHVRRILAGAVAMSLVSVPAFHGLPDVPIAPWLFMMEAAAIIALTVAGYGLLAGTETQSPRALGWGWLIDRSAAPRRIGAAGRPVFDERGEAPLVGATLLATFAVLALAAFVEVLVIEGFIRLA